MNPSSAHEINNVLAAIMAETQLLQLDGLAPQHMAALDRILSHVRRLRDLLRAVEPSAPGTSAG